MSTRAVRPVVEIVVAAKRAAVVEDRERYDPYTRKASKALTQAVRKDLDDDVVSAINDLMGIEVRAGLIPK